MAKQVGPLFFTGTVDGIIFYKLGDNYYLRSKGDYKSDKQMRKDYWYQRTLQQADRFGAASKLVKPIYYRYLLKAVRKHGLFGKLTGKVNRWLQEGKSKEEVKELLIAHCQTLALPTAKAAATGFSKEATAPPVVTTDKPMQSPSRCVKSSTSRGKQARYLSNWKVKTNGRVLAPSQAEQVLSTHSKESYSLTILVHNGRKPPKLLHRGRY